jgi:hypothetical protein
MQPTEPPVADSDEAVSPTGGRPMPETDAAAVDPQGGRPMPESEDPPTT